MSNRPRVGLLALAALATAACGNPPPPARRVAVSLFPIYDITRRVAGDRLPVDLILPPGMFDHNFEPRPQDFSRISAARLVVLAGLGLDEWGRKLAAGAGAAEVLELAPRLDPLPTPRGALMGAEHDEAGGALDPHVWLDPVRMQTATDLLVDACVRLDPAGADGFRSRGAEVKASLAALHRDIERRTRAFTKRSVVTFHGSWNYFAARYGLTIAAVVEPFPGQEPSPAYVRDVLRIVKDSHVAALFSEPQLGRRPAQVIAQESGVPLFELDPIGGTAGLESYEALLRHDTAVLEQALR